MQSFKELSLIPAIAKALETLGFESPTEIQSKALPLLLNAETIDFHGQAQTGTGKTLAFGIPLLQQINPEQKHVQALIVAPTRELVVQICQSLQKVGQYMPISIEAIYGGTSMENQIRALRKGAHIVVGTPGRLNDHLRRGILKIDKLRTLVLDEADIMLDMGFRQEVDEILAYAPKQRNIWLFSATVKQGIADIMKSHMQNPTTVRCASQNNASSTKQFFCVVPQRDRIVALSRFIDHNPNFYGFVFCATKLLTAEVAEQLVQRGYAAQPLHGDMSQAHRNRVIKRFKDREFTILIATDVAARGIDVPDISHVINYSLPEDQESYVHRIGRTGRAGKEGVSITFVTQSEVRYLGSLQRKFKLQIEPTTVPSVELVISARTEQTKEYMDTLLAKANRDESNQSLTNTLHNYSTEQLVVVARHLLEEKFFKHLKKDSSIAFAPAMALNDIPVNNSSAVEVCLNVGSDDGISAEEIKQVLTQRCSIKSDDIFKIKLIKRRTFIVIPNACADVLNQGCRGLVLAGRKVFVTRAESIEGNGFGNSRFSGNNNRRPRGRSGR